MLSDGIKHVLATRVLFRLMLSNVVVCCIKLPYVVSRCLSFLMSYSVVLCSQTIVGHT